MTTSTLEVLAAVALAGPGVTAQEVAQRLRMPPPTAYRALNTLVAQEYLVRMPDLSGFAVGRRAHELIAAMAPTFVPTAARNVLARARESTRFGLHLVTYSPMSLRLVDPDPEHPPGPERLLARHLHAGAAGKLLLAAVPDWRALLSPVVFKPLTPRTVRDAEELERHLVTVRAEGVATQVEELRQGCACVAVGVGDAGNRLRLALTVSGPPERLASLTALVPRLREWGEELRPLLT